MKMTRIFYVMAATVVIFLGLASRGYSQHLPQLIADYAGDTLWAMTAFFGVRTVFPRWKIRAAALAALLFSFSIEISQLYQAPWIDGLRRTLIGGLILGYGFLWSDLLCYCAGVGAGAVLDFFLFRRSGNENNPP